MKKNANLASLVALAAILVITLGFFWLAWVCWTTVLTSLSMPTPGYWLFVATMIFAGFVHYLLSKTLHSIGEKCRRLSEEAETKRGERS